MGRPWEAPQQEHGCTRRAPFQSCLPASQQSTLRTKPASKRLGEKVSVTVRKVVWSFHVIGLSVGFLKPFQSQVRRGSVHVWVRPERGPWREHTRQEKGGAKTRRAAERQLHTWAMSVHCPPPPHRRDQPRRRGRLGVHDAVEAEGHGRSWPGGFLHWGEKSH